MEQIISTRFDGSSLNNGTPVEPDSGKENLPDGGTVQAEVHASAEGIQESSSSRAQIDPSDIPLTENVIQRLGDNPFTKKRETLVISRAYTQVFTSLKNSGAQKTEIKELQNKYEMPDLFKPPKLAEGIPNQAAARHLKREFWRLKVQEDLCPAVARNAAALTMIATERQKNNSETLIGIENLLVESSVLTANAIWQETRSRKTLMAPAFNPAVRAALKRAETTASLYGDKTLEIAKGHLEMKSILTARTRMTTKGDYPQNFQKRG